MAAERRRGLSVRLRTTLFATLVLAVALAVAALGLFFLARSALIDSVEASATARAETIAGLAVSDALPDPLPAGGDIVAVQLVDAGGNVLVASPGAADLPPLSPVDPGGGIRSYRDSDVEDVILEPAGFDIEGEVLMLTWPVDTPAGPVTVMVAAVLETEETIDIIVELLTPLFPALLILVAAVTWWVTGRALRPVEDMRLEAESITGTNLDRRLPVPASGDEVQRLAETMNRMLARLSASSEERRRFVADASHELKSPVAAIRTMLEVARANPDATDWDALTADLLYEDERLEAVVSDLLMLARADEHRLDLRPTEVDLDDIALTEARGVGARSPIPIDTSGVVPVRLTADPQRLGQLMRNLLDNAVRHAATGVWVATATTGRDAVMTVSDDGPGIPVGEREHVFERFVRLDSDRSRHAGGSGLGLAVAREIARAHRGHLRVVDSVHGGSTLELRLPTAS